MCIFSLEVERIKDTCIYARLDSLGYQYLAYEMTAALDQDMAMILPLPTELSGTGIQDLIEFLDLSDCPMFFPYLAQSFQLRKRSITAIFGAGPEPLKVVEVGSFEASYVPTIRDFSRLDLRFGLEPKVWRQLPQYEDYGFAVFKLKMGERRIHPMAFRFLTRYKDKLFFPTVHVHNGTVPEVEIFDHRLFCQSGSSPGGKWVESYYNLGDRIPKEQDIKQVVDVKRKGFWLHMRGEFPNKDVILQATPLPGCQR